MQQIKIAILDDHQIVIDGLKLLLSSDASCKICIESTDGLQLLESLKHQSVDILISDIMMPSLNGYEVALMVKQHFPSIKIIALSMNGEGDIIYKMIEEADIKGYLLKTANKETLLQAIKKVASGGLFFPDEILQALERTTSQKKEAEQIHLTARELEIIRYISLDYTNKQMAGEMFISERTIETHRKNIFRKTQTHSVVALLELVRRLHLLS